MDRISNTRVQSLRWHQVNNIDKMANAFASINFYDKEEVRTLRNKINEEITLTRNFHNSLHASSEMNELHDCVEYESRLMFGQKFIRILNETLRELEYED